MKLVNADCDKTQETETDQSFIASVLWL